MGQGGGVRKGGNAKTKSIKFMKNQLILRQITLRR